MSLIASLLLVLSIAGQLSYAEEVQNAELDANSQDSGATEPEPKLPDAPEVTAFKKWFAENNGDRTVHVEIDYNPKDGFGLQTTKPLGVGEVYATIAPDLVVSVAAVMKHEPLGPVLTYVDHKYGTLGVLTKLQVWLLYEKFVVENSPWKPYLDVLPAPKDTHHPLLYDGDYLSALDKCEVQGSINKYKKEVEDEYEKLHSNLFDLYDDVFHGRISKENFLWARAIVDIRARWWGDEPHLVPLADVSQWGGPDLEMVHETAPAGWRLDHDGNVVATAQWAVDKGEPLREYFEKPNHWYILHKGLCLVDNALDCVQVALSVPRADPKRDQKIKNLKKKFRATTICVSAEHPDDLLEYAAIREGYGEAQCRQVYEAAVEVARRKLESYPNTRSADKGMMRGADFKERQMILFRAKEKAMLGHIMHSLQELSAGKPSCSRGPAKDEL